MSDDYTVFLQKCQIGRGFDEWKCWLWCAHPTKLHLIGRKFFTLQSQQGLFFVSAFFFFVSCFSIMPLKPCMGGNPDPLLRIYHSLRRRQFPLSSQTEWTTLCTPLRMAGWEQIWMTLLGVEFIRGNIWLLPKWRGGCDAQRERSRDANSPDSGPLCRFGRQWLWGHLLRHVLLRRHRRLRHHLELHLCSRVFAIVMVASFRIVFRKRNCKNCTGMTISEGLAFLMDLVSHWPPMTDLSLSYVHFVCYSMTCQLLPPSLPPSPAPQWQWIFKLAPRQFQLLRQWVLGSSRIVGITRG